MISEHAIKDTELTLPGSAQKWTAAGAVVGAGALGAAILTADWDWSRFLRAYLVSFAFVLSISLGALFFVILQHLTRSGWSVAVRRLAEVTAANVLPLAILFIPVILGIGDLYEWAPHGDGGAGAHAAEGVAEHAGAAAPAADKGGWLSPTWFTLRAAIYFGIWILLSRAFLRWSKQQDETGDVALTVKMQKLAPLAMILFGVTVTMAAFDLLMSLDPHWFSTIFGVYYFSGAVLACFAVLILTAVLLQRSGRLTRSITTEHYHDLGKQLFGYLVFWAYIAFSQYMLIWYANIPEETQWYGVRQTGGWATVGYILLVGHFALPFLALLPREPKRRPLILAGLALWLLVMHWVDLFWLIAPQKGVGLHFGIPEILCAVGLSSLFAAAMLYRLGGVSLLPTRDPRLAESLAFENV